MQYAKEGRAFFSVCTPGVFREIELPIDPEDRSDEEAKAFDDLCDLAEACGTHIDSTPYESG